MKILNLFYRNPVEFPERKVPKAIKSQGHLFDQTAKEGIKYAKYKKDVRAYDFIDVYGVCRVFGVIDHSGAIFHAIKKILNLGSRGYKNRLQDLIEARDSLDRAIEEEMKAQELENERK